MISALIPHSAEQVNLVVDRVPSCRSEVAGPNFVPGEFGRRMPMPGIIQAIKTTVVETVAETAVQVVAVPKRVRNEIMVMELGRELSGRQDVPSEAGIQKCQCGILQRDFVAIIGFVTVVSAVLRKTGSEEGMKGIRGRSLFVEFHPLSKRDPMQRISRNQIDFVPRIVIATGQELRAALAEALLPSEPVTVQPLRVAYFCLVPGQGTGCRIAGVFLQRECGHFLVHLDGQVTHVETRYIDPVFILTQAKNAVYRSLQVHSTAHAMPTDLQINAVLFRRQNESNGQPFAFNHV